MSGKPDKAISAFSEYKKIIPQNDKQKLEQIEQEIKYCNNLKPLLDGKPQLMWEKENIKEINTTFSDINAVFSADGKVVVFASAQLEGKSNDDKIIFFSKKILDKFDEPYEISDAINAKGNMIPCYLSTYGTHLFLLEGDDNKSVLYESKYVKKGDSAVWTTAKKLNSNINKGIVSYASIAPDGKTLFFSADRKEGLGGLDIYKSELDAKGEWGSAVNLGSKINTPFDETAPFLVDGNVLFFSSQGHSSIGGYDIFSCKRNLNGEWAEPVNIGYSMNTFGDDVFYVPASDGASGYISLQGSEAIGELDIYKVKIGSYVEEVIAQEIIEETKPVNEIKEENSTNNITGNKDNKQDSEKAPKENLATEKEIKNQTTNKKKEQQKASQNKVTGGAFTVQIAASTEEESPYRFSATENVTQNKGNDGIYRYTCGIFNSYADAMKEVSRLKTIGIENTFIINVTAISEKSCETKDMDEKLKILNKRSFSIQFSTLPKQINNGGFRSIAEYKSNQSSNGFFIYYTGNFPNYADALNERNKIRSLGYPDAYIIYTPE